MQTGVNWDEDELVVARTLSGDTNTFSFLGDCVSATRALPADTARDFSVPLAGSWPQTSATAAGASTAYRQPAVRGLSRTTPMQNSALESSKSLWNLCQASSSGAVGTAAQR